MTVQHGSMRQPSRSRKTRWQARSRGPYSRHVWLLLRVLDLLPWPWGEEMCARLFVAKALVRPSWMRKALTWAEEHPRHGQSRWRLALSICAHRGRVAAQHALLGIRSPEALRRHVVLVGEEHLRAASGGILLGFHLGSPAVAPALCAAGYRVTWIGGVRAFRSWRSEASRPVREAVDDLSLSGESWASGAALYRARRVLLDGGTIYITADGHGRDAFCVPLPGGSARIKFGWFVLRRECAVPVLPVFAHLHGHTQVITIYPPIPPPGPDSEHDMVVCRETLTALLEQYLRQFPEQCYGLTFSV